MRSRVRLLLPRRKSWRLCYDGVEMVGVLRKELRDKTRTERLMKYFRDTRGWGEEAERWLGEEVVAGWRKQRGGLVRRGWPAGRWETRHCTRELQLSE